MWPGVAITEQAISPTRKRSPSFHKRSNCEPSVAELRLQVEHVRRRDLHFANAGAGGDLAAERILHVGCCGQMIGVRVRFQDPRHLQLQLANASQHLVRGDSRDCTGAAIEVEHGIDDHGLARCAGS